MRIINKKRSYSAFLASILALPLSTIAIAQSQPIVVLEYPKSGTNQQNFQIIYLFKITIIQPLIKFNQMRHLVIY